MKISMKLLSDTIFGNGFSVPGGEDISVLHDTEGFPYFKGNTLKGIFREELIRLLKWQGKADDEILNITGELLGYGGDDSLAIRKVIFSDLTIPDAVKNEVLAEVRNMSSDTDISGTVLKAFTNMRTFTALDPNGIAKRGSLRVARCVNSGITFEGEIRCDNDQEMLVKDVLGMIKWVGTMRNRGFGKIMIFSGEEV